MKRFVLLMILLVVPAMAWGQDDFCLVDGNLVWRKVYNDTTDVKTVAYNLRAAGFKEIEVGEDLVTAQFYGLYMEYESLGYKRMSLPIYINNNDFYGFVTVQIKEDRYRVTVDRVIARNRRLGNMTMNDIGLVKGEIRDSFIGAESHIISNNFDRIFSKLSKKEDDEW